MPLLELYDRLAARLRIAGEYVWPLALRAILFWEFWEAGISKLNGDNWFAEVPWAGWQKGFPWPFDVLPHELNWLLATWAELAFSLLLLLGLFTRFAAISLLVVTMVATAAVHWPADWSGLSGLWQGYVITAKGAGNFKLPLLFLVMLMPLVFHGSGRLSIDHWLVGLGGRRPADAMADGMAVSLALLVPGLALVWVEPAWGATLMASALLPLALFRAAR